MIIVDLAAIIDPGRTLRLGNMECSRRGKIALLASLEYSSSFSFSRLALSRIPSPYRHYVMRHKCAATALVPRVVVHRRAWMCKLGGKFAQVCSVCSRQTFFQVCTVLAPLPGRCANFFSDRFRFAHRDGCSPILMSKLLIKFGCRLRCLFKLMSKLIHH